MTKKHLQFCIYYMQVGDPQVAYKMTYPRAAVKSLAAASSRLMARPDVAEWVHGTEERVHKRLMRKFENEHYDKFKDQLLSINQKRTVLTKIITGETKRVRYIKGKYGPQKVEEDLPVYAVLRAVDLDTRLENFYNYLTRSDTWRKAQNIYVNTPTLQQQVNILINQTTENEGAKDTPEPIPIKSVTESSQNLSRQWREGDRGTLASDTPASVTESPRNLSRHWREGDRGTLASDTPVSVTESPRNLSRQWREGDRGTLASDTPVSVTESPGNLSPHWREGDRRTLASDTPASVTESPRNLSRHWREGDRGTLTQDTSESDNTSHHPGYLGVPSCRTPHTKKTPRFLTKLNKIHRDDGQASEQ